MTKTSTTKVLDILLNGMNLFQISFAEKSKRFEVQALTRQKRGVGRNQNVFCKENEQTKGNDVGSATKRNAKSQRKKANAASSARSLRALGSRNVDYKVSPYEDNIVRPDPARKKRLVSSKTRKEPGVESEHKLKKVGTSKDTTGTVLLSGDKVPLSLPVCIASEEICSSSASMPVSYIATCRQPPGYATEYYDCGEKRSVQDLIRVIHISLSHRAHNFKPMEDAKYIRDLTWSRATLHQLHGSGTIADMKRVGACELALKRVKGG